MRCEVPYSSAVSVSTECPCERNFQITPESAARSPPIACCDAHMNTTSKPLIRRCNLKAAFLLAVLLAVASNAKGGGAYNIHWALGANRFDKDNVTFKCTGPGTYQVLMNGMHQGFFDNSPGSQYSFTEEYA